MSFFLQTRCLFSKVVSSVYKQSFQADASPCWKPSVVYILSQTQTYIITNELKRAVNVSKCEKKSSKLVPSEYTGVIYTVEKLLYSTFQWIWKGLSVWKSLCHYGLTHTITESAFQSHFTTMTSFSDVMTTSFDWLRQVWATFVTKAFFQDPEKRNVCNGC